MAGATPQRDPLQGRLRLTLPCASITLIKFQGVISAGGLATFSTPSVYAGTACADGQNCNEIVTERRLTPQMQQFLRYDDAHNA